MWTYNADGIALNKNGGSVTTSLSNGARFSMTISNMTGQCYSDFMSPDDSPSVYVTWSLQGNLAASPFDFATMASANLGSFYFE